MTEISCTLIFSLIHKVSIISIVSPVLTSSGCCCWCCSTPTSSEALQMVDVTVGREGLILWKISAFFFWVVKPIFRFYWLPNFYHISFTDCSCGIKQTLKLLFCWMLYLKIIFAEHPLVALWRWLTKCTKRRHFLDEARWQVYVFFCEYFLPIFEVATVVFVIERTWTLQMKATLDGIKDKCL